METKTKTNLTNISLQSNADDQDNSMDLSSLTASSFQVSMLFVIILALVLLVTFASYCIGRLRGGRNGAVAGGSVPTDVVAVDEAALQRFPKLLYSEAKLQINQGSCSVCLGDYGENDVLRLLPHCGHAFHLECVDPWLRLRPTCPLCRSSPHVVAESRDELDL
ncbi:hypothetical protein TIFTF001_036885 [Ficus carica]|uniref:RING-type domain-containing protein n=1 Tax=Ficus carica TaxID=3494 RepID=A0AA88E542_FICCA|nr:hypothetical protein TIFTF001_036871 [Ficus carica]GMN67818.1 hypothetical protein TIFTF001_036875 [Ficus carica]GMN67821.1 hypothetical protein TIFTF001_036881 [Ficus carica]GMN67828.1 hypothetical protein TIFTF001_036885 [Ficus carica]